jgi:hypothetical protein
MMLQSSFFRLVCAAVLLAVCCSCGNRAKALPGGGFRMTADELLAAYRANENAAVEKYDDKFHELSGMVIEVRVDGTGVPVVCLGDRGTGPVACEFAFTGSGDNAVARVMTLMPGLNARIRGQSVGLSSNEEFVVLISAELLADQ